MKVTLSIKLTKKSHFVNRNRKGNASPMKKYYNPNPYTVSGLRSMTYSNIFLHN